MIIRVTKHALMITGFVFIMMLLIEYINVQTGGNWQKKLKRNRWGQYLLSAFLGVTPGCLGAFSVVAMYSHNVVSFGALVAAMIATSGDETYVMLTMFPRKAVLLMGILLMIGMICGYLVDLLLKKGGQKEPKFKHDLQLHDEELRRCYPKGQIAAQLKNLSLQRALLVGMLSIFICGLLFGMIGPQSWSWIRITLLCGSLFALFVVLTVPEHFLEEHLWQHVTKRHLPRIFLWTFGTLLLTHILTSYLDLESWIRGNYLIVLLIACLVGIIPESGPHMIFVTLFAEGSIPFSILLASSIVQDGHGTLPLLAESKRTFVLLKVINVIIGFIFGLAGIITHW